MESLYSTVIHSNTLQHATKRCDTVQYAAICCNTRKIRKLRVCEEMTSV